MKCNQNLNKIIEPFAKPYKSCDVGFLEFSLYKDYKPVSINYSELNLHIIPWYFLFTEPTPGIERINSLYIFQPNKNNMPHGFSCLFNKKRLIIC